MFEITAGDIASLPNDEVLRELIGRLCEAEMRKRRLSTAAVTWGGHQKASDGGVDVRVRANPDIPFDGYIPSFSTAFQVKKQDMPASKIGAEMRPGGQIRPAIQALADEGGAYTIVSSEGSTSDTPLLDRRKAMAAAVCGIPNADKLKLDFLDRTRIASWVREFHSEIIWVRSQIGRAITGWQPFGPWATGASDSSDEFLLDEGLRIIHRPAEEGSERSATKGLEAIRSILEMPAASVRLVGLSGVGKTRLVQALFDDRVGTNALDATLAIYTNMGNEPDPQPFHLVSDLVSISQRNIVIIDNCPADLHLQLTGIVKKTSSAVSLITIEYDIRDDQPESTEVFELLVASDELIEKLLRKRYPKLSQVDAATAAEFAGGNARVAIALADTVQKSGSLANLNNDQLFKRLFVQRWTEDKPLQDMAEVCSLLYSFNGVNTAKDGELSALAQLVDAKPSQIYAAASELESRDLAQRRGEWRAILPHAIANRLAEMALRKLSPDDVEKVLVDGSERTAKSFSRRLGFLHKSAEARLISKKWLSEGGILSDVLNLSDIKKEMFDNIAPVDPATTLDAIERAITSALINPPISVDRSTTLIIRSLAYSPELFEKAIQLIGAICIHGDEYSQTEAREIHKSLFGMYLSGTHATALQRAEVINSLLNAKAFEAQKLGIEALDSMLESSHFSSHHEFSFGGHSRDYGLSPNTLPQLKGWYNPAFSVVRDFANGPLGHLVRKRLADSFRGIWSRGLLWSELEELFKHVSGNGFWREGWLAVRQTRHYDAGNNETESFKRLTGLAEMLRPVGLIDEIRAKALIRSGAGYDLDDDASDEADIDDMESAAQRRAELVIGLGERLARDEPALSELMAEMVTSEGYTAALGMGLARGAPNARNLWSSIAEAFQGTAPQERSTAVLAGILSEIAKNNTPLASELLDEALTTDTLAEAFVRLQLSVNLDKRGVERLLRALEIGKAPVESFGNLAFGRVTDQIEAGDLAELLGDIWKHAKGHSIAIHVLSMRLSCDKDAKREHAEELLQLGRRILEEVDLSETKRNDDHSLGTIAKVSLRGDLGIPPVQSLCRQFVGKGRRGGASFHSYNSLLAAMFAAHPSTSFDGLFTGDKKIVGRTTYEFQSGIDLFRSNPFAKVELWTLLDWCDRDAAIRYPLMASIGPVFIFQNSSEAREWADFAAKLIEHAVDPLEVVDRLAARVSPNGFVGSWSAAIEQGARLLVKLPAPEGSAVAGHIQKRKEEILASAARHRASEDEEHRKKDQTFE